ncbi:hypothetical protein CpipJ_CPIJ004758 [Culex quinquefasciatus]|uniref:Uncharacterized protein n=1 Tax=Culex quinquefasciatus TaxID=7176 RepID=B0WDP1_CULQU|nr:hypothetical protein CpipJ_CPIJ004758 [Culex quinquefasciatus]|eukprot:XP_001846825.1 hypothetical protein CpipJ_CPIJ004758 [Culex quinquefasciatus]
MARPFEVCPQWGWLNCIILEKILFYKDPESESFTNEKYKIFYK